MIVKWKFNHTLLQDKLMSCKYYKHISSFAVIFMMLSLVMLSTWMIVASVRCDRVQVANNMLSVIMVVLQLILMRQVHCWPLTKFWRTLVMFDQFWDFDRLVEDGAPR